MLPALAGGTLGGLLGQASDATGFFRNQLMDALNQPRQGSALLEKWLGADPNDPLTQLGGAFTEMATDPLSYAGFLSGAVGGALRGADALGDATRLQRAAGAAGAANTANDFRFGSESLQRMARQVTPDDVAAAGPRVGVYNRNPTRITASELGGSVSPDVASAGIAGTGKGAMGKARANQMGMNAPANDMMMGDALSMYDAPFEGQTMAMPGMMLDPQSALRGNMLAQMNPDDAMQGINPLIEALKQRMARQQELSPWEMAALGGAGAGAVGAGIYSGM